MPYEYSVADADGLLHVTAWGVADLAEIVALLWQMEADARVPPRRSPSSRPWNDPAMTEISGSGGWSMVGRDAEAASPSPF